MSHDVFTELSLVLIVASLVAIIMRLLRQPLIMSYIISGIIVGPSFLNIIKSETAFEIFSEIGITLLLFIIGLELSIAAFRRLGKAVFVTALALFGVMMTVGYMLSAAFGYSSMEALIIGLALFFSSTIIIAKVLSDKKQLHRLNGQIAIGVILFDDIVATFALLFVTAQTGQALDAWDIGFLVLKGLIAAAVLIIMGTKVLPKLSKFIAGSQELLFIFALAWGFGVAIAFSAIGFSVEVGALFAGVTLAHLPYVHQIGSKLKPLRDFFIILFFIALGQSLAIENLAAALVPALIMSVAVLILKPIVVMISLGSLRYTKRTSFATGINLSQISEFSIILVVLALSAGLVSPEIGAVITLTAMITIAVSTYLMKYDDWLFGKFEPLLHIFERKVTDETPPKTKAYSVVIFGYLNGGAEFVKTFRRLDEKFVVIDYDPDVITQLEKKEIEYIYGDATDPGILAEIDFEKTRLAINTIADHNVNLALIRYLRRHNPKAIIICYSSDHREAAELYRLGANYVVLPHHIGSRELSAFLQNHGLDKKIFNQYRKHHLGEIDKSAD